MDDKLQLYIFSIICEVILYISLYSIQNPSRSLPPVYDSFDLHVHVWQVFL